tara:strand:+ start:229 stop:1404 length:1176 start_codon:yes stop_codon:yes gene_type:complete
MPKINPYGSPTDFMEGEKITKKSFTDLADNIAGADGAIDENNIRQEGLDGRNFASGVYIHDVPGYQKRTKNPGPITCSNFDGSISADFKKVATSTFFGEASTSRARLRFNWQPEINTHAIIRCSGVISTKPETTSGGSRVNGFYVPDRYTIDVGLLIRGKKPDGDDPGDTSDNFSLRFDRDMVEGSYFTHSPSVWPYQRVCLNDAYASLAQAGVRKNVTDWRGYKLDPLGKIEPPESASDGVLGGIIMPEQGHATEWLYDRKSYMYYNFNLMAHLSSEHNSGTSFLLNDSWRSSSGVAADPLETREYIVDLVYRTNMDQFDLRSGTERNFEKDLTDSDKYPGVGAVGDYPDYEKYQGFGSAQHYDKKLSDIGFFEGFRITDLTMNVQIINR